MKTVLKAFGGIFASAILIVGIIYFIYPGLMVSAVQSLSASGAGLTKKSINLDGYTAHYYEGGDPSQPTLMLLHGLNDDKNSFVTSIRELSLSYHIVLPDLQAHGENAKTEGRDYSIAGQAQFIKQLSDALRISQVFIGGNSMGGHTAASFAARFPANTHGLILLNATGIQLENESVYVYFPEKIDVQFLKDFFDNAFVTPPAFPQPVLQHLVNKTNKSIPFINNLIKQVETGDDFRMNEKAESIKAPTLVLWGKHDPIVPLSYGELFTKKIPDARLKVFENAGHSAQFEIPDQLQAELKAFMESLELG